MTVDEATQSLRTLALEAREAVDRATAASRDAEADRALFKLRSEAEVYSDGLEETAFCLRSNELTLTDDERALLATALRGALDALSVVASRLANEADDVREDQRWKVLKDAMRRLTDASDVVRQAAVERLIASLPAPGRGLTAVLPPNDERRGRYLKLTEAYEEAKEEIASDSDVAKLRNICNRLDALADEMKRSGVPEEHRESWAALLGGTLTVGTLPLAFVDWLKAEGHADQVVLAYR